MGRPFTNQPLPEICAHKWGEVNRRRARKHGSQNKKVEFGRTCSKCGRFQKAYMTTGDLAKSLGVSIPTVLKLSKEYDILPAMTLKKGLVMVRYYDSEQLNKFLKLRYLLEDYRKIIKQVLHGEEIVWPWKEKKVLKMFLMVWIIT